MPPDFLPSRWPMRNLLKICHFLTMWGMVPLIVWSGCPTAGCACAAAAKDESASCGCCAANEAQAKKSCCCRAKNQSNDPAAASIGCLPPGIDLGLLVHCNCGRSASQSVVTLQSERKSLGEDFLFQEDDAFALHEPGKVVARAVIAPPVPRGDFDRVVLFRAFLI